jgi:hypothetical protein
MLKPYFAVRNGLAVNTFECVASERVSRDESLDQLSRQMMRDWPVWGFSRLSVPP